MKSNLQHNHPGHPQPTATEPLRKLVIRRPYGTNWALPDVSEEALWACAVDGGGFRVENIPFFVKALSFADVVDAAPDPNGMLVVSGVRKRGGHSTFRIVVDDTAARSRHSDYHALIRGLTDLGVGIEAANPTFYALDIPPGVPIDAVCDLLEVGFDAGVWKYEEADSERTRP